MKASIRPRRGGKQIHGEHIRGSVDKVLMHQDKKRKGTSRGIQTLAVLDQTAKFPRESEKGTKLLNIIFLFGKCGTRL